MTLLFFLLILTTLVLTGILFKRYSKFLQSEIMDNASIIIFICAMLFFFCGLLFPIGVWTSKYYGRSEIDISSFPGALAIRVPAENNKILTFSMPIQNDVEFAKVAGVSMVSANNPLEISITSYFKLVVNSPKIPIKFPYLSYYDNTIKYGEKYEEIFR